MIREFKSKRKEFVKDGVSAVKKLTKMQKAAERKKVKAYRKKIHSFIDKLEDQGKESGEYVDEMHNLLSTALKNKEYKVIKAFITLEAALKPIIKDGEETFIGVS